MKEYFSSVKTDEGLIDRLAESRKLTPSDFQVVRDQCEFMEESEITDEYICNALFKELDAKSGKKAIGF
jgi:hypothetical protein